MGRRSGMAPNHRSASRPPTSAKASRRQRCEGVLFHLAHCCLLGLLAPTDLSRALPRVVSRHLSAHTPLSQRGEYTFDLGEPPKGDHLTRAVTPAPSQVLPAHPHALQAHTRLMHKPHRSTTPSHHTRTHARTHANSYVYICILCVRERDCVCVYVCVCCAEGAATNAKPDSVGRLSKMV